ncbi:Phenylalanyl-tRNA synthetase beta chain [Candidatus Phytoplasma mali]|uniref:Phenylalanine--tRNA ligase beta subunit n=1 Tax=Phytoplasma mali (strain AT) TaxID=482235 RepID=B3R0A2_PHYMT|nr:phenylalanine--tRNA ligase subunit beta [Candidatus Phytoplasma mali]CAP18266.1 Phenylalanyl-tRNA synthetase beta chain [Candidatus Phytoplasma mali]
MKINENVIKKYLSIIPKDITNLVNNHITEVEKFYFLTKNHNLIIGKILNFEKIINSKYLYLVTVDIAHKLLNIICSYNNLIIGKKVIVAQEGSYLEGLKSFIKTKKIQNINSDGMLCSLTELGISNQYLTSTEKKGIYYFSDDVDLELGSDVLKFLSLKGFMLELSLTPDRVDLYSHIGFIKDLNAVSKQKNDFLEQQLIVKNQEISKLNYFQIKIENKDCYEYNVRYIENITIKTSPLWIRNILLKADILPVNNLVDIANLILIEYGVPIHFFDADKLINSSIIVRNANLNEKITTIDNKEYVLNSEDLVIANDNIPIELAGIISLNNNNIDLNTKNIILTTAYFEPKIISKTSKKLKLSTNISLYYERGIDQTLIVKALERACQLLQEITNAKITKNIVSKKIKLRKNPKITLSLNFIRNKTGINFLWSQIEKFLKLLEYKIIIDINSFVFNDLNQVFYVTAPLRRYDVNIPEDVISDLLRMYGYHNVYVNNDNILNTVTFKTIKQNKIRNLRYLLQNIGFCEIITYSLVSDKISQLFPYNKNKVKLLNPLSQDKIILRQNLIASFIEVLSYNQKRNNVDNAFFEIGKVYFPESEYLNLALGLSGNFINSGWHKNNINSSFFVLKGILERIAFFLKINLQLKKTNIYHSFCPGIQANIIFNNQKIGFMGETNCFINKQYQLTKSYLLEISLNDEILNQNTVNHYQEISKFPSIRRDLSFIIDKKYDFSDISKTIKEFISILFFKFELLDVYYSDKLFSHQYSLTIGFIFNDLDGNLNKIKVDDIMIKIKNKLYEKYKIQVR